MRWRKLIVFSFLVPWSPCQSKDPYLERIRKKQIEDVLGESADEARSNCFENEFEEREGEQEGEKVKFNDLNETS